MVTDAMKSKTIVFTDKQQTEIIEDDMSAPGPDEMSVTSTDNCYTFGVEGLAPYSTGDIDKAWCELVKL